MDNEVTRLAYDVFNRRADDYQKKFMDVSLYADSLDHFCGLLKPGSKVLELACGPGNITKYLLTARPDLKIHATEIAPAMLELARGNNPNATFAFLDARQVRSLDVKFDAIMVGFCLPYLSREEIGVLFKDCAQVLNPGGCIYISTMEDDYSRSRLHTTPGGESLFIYYHEENSLAQAFSEAGFEVQYTRRKFQKQESGEINTDLLMIAVLSGG